MTQHQRFFYAQLSFLHKLKWYYVLIFDQNLIFLKRHILFLMISWWNVFQIIIVSIAKKIITIHDVLLINDGHFIIYMNNSGIDNKIKTFTVIMITSISNEFFIIMNKKQVFLDFLSKFTVYCGKLMKINIILNIIKNNLQNKSIIIFINNQIVIFTMRKSNYQFDQYVLMQIISKIQILNIIIHIHWISVHQEIPGNETVNVAIKKTTGWNETFRSRPGEPFLKKGLHVLISVIKMNVRFKIQNQWNQIWFVEKYDCVIYKLIKTFTTNVFQKFKNMFKAENSIIIQIHIKKIDFKNYLHHIEIESSLKCFCEAVKQTIKHTLLNCFKHDAVQKKLLQINDKNLTIKLGYSYQTH